MARAVTKSVAIIVAHPDDETLWAGGTILSHPLWSCYIACLSRKKDAEIQAVRDSLGITPDQLMILTVSGDAASKGSQEVMQALARIDSKGHDWKYVCKVWPKPRTLVQNLADMEMAESLGIAHKVIYATNIVSRNFMPWLIGACDIYAAPSRLEGFGMPQVEAGACGKPVISTRAMGMLDTLVHGETAFLADVAQKIVVNQVILGVESGYEEKHTVIFTEPRTVYYRASIDDNSLFVNTLVYSYLRIIGKGQRAEMVRRGMSRFTIKSGTIGHHVEEGLAILSGLASPSRAEKMITWIENECAGLRMSGELAVDLPPNFFPFIKPGDSDWLLRYSIYNNPGEYHNGGIWPFICGLYIAALVAARRFDLAEKKLLALTKSIRISASGNTDFGFNEWLKAQDGMPMGQDWQTWSAALYLYAAKCVEERSTPFFDDIRNSSFVLKTTDHQLLNEFHG